MIYQLLFHFGPPLPGILTRPHVMLRPLEDPAIPSEAVDDTPAPGWLCARRSRASSHLSAQVLGILRCRDVAGQPCIQVIRSVTAAARSASFQAGPLRRWRPPTFLFTSPSLKEDGENPQSRPSRIFWPACLPQAELANSTRPTRNNTIFSTRTGMPWFIRGSSLLPS